MKFTACDATLSEQARTTTSTDAFALRVAAATEIINQAIPASDRLSHNGELITIIYSDGGTQTYTYTAASSLHTPKEETLQFGTGVPGSACR